MGHIYRLNEPKGFDFDSLKDEEKRKKRRERLFVLKYRFITVGLFFLQWIAIIGFGWSMKYYYETGELPGLIISLMALVVSYKSFSYRLEYKQGFGHRIQKIIDENPMNKLNRKQKRAVRFNKKRRN